MADAAALGRTREAAVGDEGDARGEPHAADSGGRGEHLAHARTAGWALVADDHDVAGVDLSPEDRVARLLLGVEAAGGARMGHHRGVDGRLLDDASVGGDVAVEHAQGSDLREGVVVGSDDLAVRRTPAALKILRNRSHAGQGAGVKKTKLRQLVHDHRHAADGVQVDERAWAGRLELDQVRRAGRSRVPVVHGDGASRLHGNRGKVEHRVRGAAEGHVALHGVVDGGGSDDVLDADALLQQLHDLHAGVLGQAQTLRVNGGDGSVAGKRDAQGLAQAVHGVGGEHAGAGSAGGAGGVLEIGQVVLAHSPSLDLADSVKERVEVGGGAVVATALVTREHGAAGHKDRGDIDAKGPQNHARDNLVAVGDADRGVELVAMHCDLEAVGDSLTRHEAVVHTVVVHGDAVADTDRRDLDGDSAGHVNARLDGIGNLVEVVVAGDDVVA